VLVRVVASVHDEDRSRGLQAGDHKRLAGIILKIQLVNSRINETGCVSCLFGEVPRISVGLARSPEIDADVVAKFAEVAQRLGILTERCLYNGVNLRLPRPVFRPSASHFRRICLPAEILQLLRCPLWFQYLRPTL